MNISETYHILEVTSSSTLKEIKKEYRTKAKILHPDKNPSSNANRDFILLDEAYDYVIQVKEGLQPVPNFSNRPRGNSAKTNGERKHDLEEKRRSEENLKRITKEKFSAEF